MAIGNGTEPVGSLIFYPLFYTASDATPSSIGTTASAGTSYDYARADHVHNITSATVTTALGYTPPTTNTTYAAGTTAAKNISTTSAAGTTAAGTPYAAWDHVHAITKATVTSVLGLTPSAAASKGVVTAVTSASEDLPTSKAVNTAISDAISAANVPAVSTATPQAVATVAATGTAAAYAREDHVHAITSATITTALGYVPLKTQYLSKNIVGGSTTATANVNVTANGIYLNHLEDSSVQSSHKIVGAGGTTVTATTSNGGNIITINSTTYSAMTTAAATTGTATGGYIISPKVLHGERAS